MVLFPHGPGLFSHRWGKWTDFLGAVTALTGSFWGWKMEVWHFRAAQRNHMPKSREAAGLSQQVGSGHTWLWAHGVARLLTLLSLERVWEETSWNIVLNTWIKHKIKVCFPQHKGTLPEVGDVRRARLRRYMGPVQIPLCIAVMEGKGKGNFSRGQKHGIVCFACICLLSAWPAGWR